MERTDLTIGQFSLLNDIKWLKSCNKSTLAQCAKLDRTTIIRNLRILYKRGYIAETPGTDKRNNLIRLTDSGEAAIAEGMVFWEQAQAKIKATFGRDNLENFMRISADIESLI
jgi:DNA-binding MarR family transcriptional regulator